MNNSKLANTKETFGLIIEEHIDNETATFHIVGNEITKGDFDLTKSYIKLTIKEWKASDAVNDKAKLIAASFERFDGVVGVKLDSHRVNIQKNKSHKWDGIIRDVHQYLMTVFDGHCGDIVILVAHRTSLVELVRDCVSS